MLPQEIIRAKRDGAALPEAEIAAFVRGVSEGAVADAQIAAFAMAVFLRGMEASETVALTRAMTHSGRVIDWSSAALSGPILDKHSTGGVGDCTSLILAPIVAACGGFVPMISGRGLGHTGGTLDKLEAIPGYAATPALDRFARVVREIGCAIVGQSADLAPADRRIYAVRDVTATVESIPLITASILSKKLAAGLQGLVMDVKTGGGAFMPTRAAAEALASSIAAVARGAGLPTVALVTDMDRPLARSAGNAVETLEAIEVLTGRRKSGRLTRLTLELAAEMLTLGGLAEELEVARTMAGRALASGAAAERFARMAAALGGPSDLLERPETHLPAAPIVRPVFAAETGAVASIDTRALGLAVVALGGGRRRPEDAVDPAVGLSEIATWGEPVDGRPLAFVHARNETAFEATARAVRAAHRVGAAPDKGDRTLVRARIVG
jgi:thymidine phosphorylase